MNANAKATFLMSHKPYIAACVRNAARRMGVKMGDLDTDDVIGMVVEKVLRADVREETVKTFVATVSRTTTLDYLHLGDSQASYFGQSVNVTDARLSESTDDDASSVGYTATDGGVDAERALLAAEKLAEVREACEDLTGSQRDVILAWLDAGEDFDVETYAATIGKTPANVRVNLSKARTALAEMF